MASQKQKDLMDELEDVTLKGWFSNTEKPFKYVVELENYSRSTVGEEKTAAQVVILTSQDEAPHSEGESLTVDCKLNNFKNYYLKFTKGLLAALSGNRNAARAEADAAISGKYNGTQFVIVVSRGREDQKKPGKFFSNYEFKTLDSGLEEDANAA